MSELIKRFNVKTDEGMQAALEQSIKYSLVKDLIKESNLEDSEDEIDLNDS